MTVAFDTGSDDLWVAGACLYSHNATYCSAPQQFSPEKSETSKDQQWADKLTMSHQGVNISGEVYSDSVIFEGR